MTVDSSLIDAAVLAVRRASALTVSVQGHLESGETLTKGDQSPVTIADFAAQAIVCGTLVEQLGAVEVVGEEDAADLRNDETGLTSAATALVSNALGRSVDSETVLDWIALGSASADRDRFWTLDPIDGTKGFLRGDQFAIALALIEHGEVVLGVLGCPRMSTSGVEGSLFVAVDGATRLFSGDGSTPLVVNTIDPPTVSDSRLCESVESGHSDQGQSAEIARLLGVGTEPYRIDSQCKYGAVARGDASIYLRLPTRADYVEKIWDHAAGAYVVECAGGRVSDVNGEPLDFGRGKRLEANRGVVATSGRFHDEVITAVRSVLG